MLAEMSTLSFCLLSRSLSIFIRANVYSVLSFPRAPYIMLVSEGKSLQKSSTDCTRSSLVVCVDTFTSCRNSLAGLIFRLGFGVEVHSISSSMTTSTDV